MIDQTCCITGHRDIPDDQVANVKRLLQQEIERAVADGYTRFISGFARGADQYFAELVAQIRQTNASLRLEAAIPYRERCFQLQKHDDTKALLAACTDIYIVSEAYAPDVFMLRNRYMVRSSQRVIAVYDGREKGGTAATLRYARANRRQIRQILISSDTSKERNEPSAPQS